MTEPPRWLRPRALGPGARVALVAPAGPVTSERLERSEQHCRGLGLEPVTFPSVREEVGFLAGTDAQRLADLQAAFDDPSMDAVWAIRGGYGTIRIVDDLNLGRQLRDPIPFIGFSDNTTIHVAHAALRVISFHGPHPGVAFPSETEAAFRSVLFSRQPAGHLPLRATDPPPEVLADGRAEGPLWGGNLATLASLCGSTSPLSARGRILFLEDVGEAAYRVDRMLTQLERAGVFDGIAGVALGRFSETPENESGSLRTVLRGLAGDLGVPVVADLPFGHTEHNCTLPIGVRARLDGEAGSLEIVEAAVERSGRTVLPME